MSFAVAVPGVLFVISVAPRVSGKGGNEQAKKCCLTGARGLRCC